ncbi:hypothetical protein BCR34DRAFT_585914 [Clohesyomyces aquaticus]|uniref:Uncharacterized protein n=1 Tax=Clohesyomyces aquaticus TaxID=1231657 RepID=A0A1Y1ZW61_9PLEO|nr:hypothetical protein BCR34DRAFT_585914 [Clohesyomyces aquaticus]
MAPFSAPVSMSNPFVNEDIRRLVRAQLRTGREFRRWPDDLLTKIEHTVSTGAQGMFWWAVCQVEVIKRLKCDRWLVESTLKNLPKTLHETYDRILIAIPIEDRIWVYHVLAWICLEEDLPFLGDIGKPMMSSFVLKAATRSATSVAPHLQVRHYDLETLRELCGCLVQVSDLNPKNANDTSKEVTLAQYTVREYLDLPTPPFGLQEVRKLSQVPIRHTFQVTVFKQVLYMTAIESDQALAHSLLGCSISPTLEG